MTGFVLLIAEDLRLTQPKKRLWHSKIACNSTLMYTFILHLKE